MNSDRNIGLDFEIDELINSIKNTISGDIFKTNISRLIKDDLKLETDLIGEQQKPLTKEEEQKISEFIRKNKRKKVSLKKKKKETV